jgi:hypothetical protein
VISKTTGLINSTNSYLNKTTPYYYLLVES